MNIGNKKFYHIIGQARATRIMGITAVALLSLFLVLSAFPIIDNTDSAQGTAGTVEVPTITITSAGGNTASVDITPTSSTGTFAVSDSSSRLAFNVSTSNYTGYTLTIKGGDNLGQLTNTSLGDTLDSITTATDANTFETDTTNTYINKWGYKPNVLNSATNTNFLPAPTTTETLLDNQATATSQDYTIDIAARVDYTKPVGTYTNTYILTATANPVAYAINYYDIAGAGGSTTPIATQSSSTNTAATITLNPTYTSGSAPTRDTYTFKSWCKGTVNTTTSYNTSTKIYSNPATICTGTEYTTSMPIDPTLDNTNLKLYAVWTPTTVAQAYGSTTMTMQNMSPTICNKITPNQWAVVTDSRDSQQYHIARLEDGRCWMLDNLKLNLNNTTTINALSTSNTNVDTNSLKSLKEGNRSAGSRYATAGLTKSNWTTNDYSYSAPLVNISGKCNSSYNTTEPCVSPYQDANYSYNTVMNVNKVGPGDYKIGAYYNYCAASAGNYCFGSGTSYGASSGNAQYDICPSKWRLFTGGTGGEAQVLWNAIYAKYPSTAKNASSPYSFQSMLSTSVAGFYTPETAHAQGVAGLFLSSTRGSDYSSYYLRVSSTNVDSYSGTSGRAYGYSVRCIAKN